MKATTTKRAIFTGISLLALAGCADTVSVDDGSTDDLTSNTALQRKLKFDGIVYVTKGLPNEQVVGIVKKQTQTAFGALRTSNVGVATRELGKVDASTFRRRTVTVVTPSAVAGGQPTRVEKDEVQYTYVDDAVVPKSMGARSALPLAVLNFTSAAKDRVLRECTAGDAHAREFADGAMWYVFEPSLPQCASAMRAEQAAIDVKRAALTSPETEVVPEEINRLYVPTVMSLGAADINTRPSYPEYDRLFNGSGGAASGKLVISMIQGMQADWAAGQRTTLLSDGAYQETIAQLSEVLAGTPGFKFVSSEPAADFSKLEINGKTLAVDGVSEFVAWEKSGSVPASKLQGTGLTSNDVRMAAAKLMHKRWVRFEYPLRATIAGVAKDITVQLNVYFGAEGDAAPYRQAIKNSDVVTYNGHSYIGYGPLDPKNFAAADFSAGYQLFVVNSCVSYNYYDGDYFPRKTGGTKNLDVISNGLEAYLGHANKIGSIVRALLSGRQLSYSELLKAADEGPYAQYANYTATDPLRVVDGELDNVYKPASKPITLAPR